MVRPAPALEHRPAVHQVPLQSSSARMGALDQRRQRGGKMTDIWYDSYMVGVITQIVGGVLSGLIVHWVTRSQSSISDLEIRRLFQWKVEVPRRAPLAFLLNGRYVVFYVVILSGIAGLTLLQDPREIAWHRIALYVLLVTWWSMVALNVFVLMDGAGFEGRLPNPILLFVSILVPVIGHTKSVAYTLFAFVTKVGVGVLLYGFLHRAFHWQTHSILSVLLMAFALVDALFYASLFLSYVPEFPNWRDGRFIVNELGWPRWK
jgi:hypothetical protein